MGSKDKGFVLSGGDLAPVTWDQKFAQWWYGATEPFIVRFGDYMLRDEKRAKKFVEMSKPKSLPSGVIISTDAACRFVDFIYNHKSENGTARMAITKCVCQTALGRYKEPVMKDMALLYIADMYTTMKHTGIKEKFTPIETAQEAKDMLHYFDECGLIHNVLYCNSSGKWTFVLCNCDDEICVPFRSYIAGRRGEFGAGPEIVELDKSKCIGIENCGKCLERCKLRACTADSDGTSGVILDECLGCGLCISTCSGKARTLKPRENYQHEDILTTKILLGEHANK